MISLRTTCYSVLLLLALGCKSDSITPAAITSVAYTISGGIIGRQTTLSVTPQTQALKTNVRFSSVVGRQGPCAVEVALTPQEWQTLMASYDDRAFRNVPAPTGPDCCDLIFSSITVTAGSVVRRADAHPTIQPFVSALNSRLAALEAQCP